MWRSFCSYNTLLPLLLLGLTWIRRRAIDLAKSTASDAVDAVADAVEAEASDMTDSDVSIPGSELVTRVYLQWSTQP